MLRTSELENGPTNRKKMKSRYSSFKFGVKIEMKKFIQIIPLILISAVSFNSCEDAVPNTRAAFEITIENLSTGEIATPLSPGVYLLKERGFPLFFDNAQDYGDGLTDIAGDGNPTQLLESLSNNPLVISSGRLPLILPGTSETISLEASYGTFFNFANMFVQSNDLFYAFDEDGIHLFEPDGSPINGDFTRFVWLWDVGSEQNQEPYVGSFQPPRQSAPGDGVEENGRVRLVNDEFTYPPKFSIIRITVQSRVL